MRKSHASRSLRRRSGVTHGAWPAKPTLLPAGTALAVCAAVAAACVAVTVPLWWSVASPMATMTALQAEGSSRLVAVIADLHMGLGRDEAGEWHVHEDFRWGEEFALFLEALDAEGGGATDLVLNGDTFELDRLAGERCAAGDPALGCTAPEALARLERVLAAHADTVEALAAFAASGSNRVFLVPGEHDAALLFPALARRVERALGAPGARATVAADGSWRSDDGRIYVEHGHQIGWRVPTASRRGRSRSWNGTGSGA